jgi:hypothetical protein
MPQPMPHSVALRISAVAVVVTIGSTVFATLIAPDGSTEQGASFVVTGVSIVSGIAAGLASSLTRDEAVRRPALRWSAGNLVVGLACAAIELLAAIHNM